MLLMGPRQEDGCVETGPSDADSNGSRAQREPCVCLPHVLQAATIEY